MAPRRLLPLLAAAAAALCAAPPAQASTLKRSFTLQAGEGFRALVPAPGERPVVRRPPGLRAVPGRAKRRRSLLYFAQITDLQLVDEASPARREYLAGPGGWRPQEALTTQAAEQLVRALNRHRTSPLRTASRRRARLALTLVTGDQTDNAQLNEVRWYLALLEGGRIDPSSGSAAATCEGAPAGYTGVQDHDDYPAGVSAQRRAAYWDPDRGGAVGRYGDLLHPGLMERAQRPFTARGLATPWYALPGNHDVLRQGFAPARHPAFDDALATGCRKAFPSDALPPGGLGARSQADLLAKLAAPETLEQLARDSRPVLADPARRMVGRREFKALHGTEDRGHGFGLVDRAELRRSRGAASYYAFTPRRGVRIVALDTAAEGGRSAGNLDHPQYRWLARQLRRARDELVVLTGHHPLGEMTNEWADERVPPCETAASAGCDADPRPSRPIHRGAAGPRSLLALLRLHPQVVAYVAGHAHRNQVTPYFRAGRGFWEVVTASSIDFPGQARLLELTDNRDGTLSLHGTLVDQAAPLRPPAAGTPAAGMTDAQLASLARALAGNGQVARFAAAALGARADRNVELLVRDPR